MKWKAFDSLKRIIYDCREAQRLIVKKQESGLRPGEYLRYKVHLCFCDICRGFQRFSKLLNDFFSRERRQREVRPGHRLSEEEKSELQKKVDELIK